MEKHKVFHFFVLFVGVTHFLQVYGKATDQERRIKSHESVVNRNSRQLSQRYMEMYMHGDDIQNIKLEYWLDNILLTNMTSCRGNAVINFVAQVNSELKIRAGGYSVTHAVVSDNFGARNHVWFSGVANTESEWVSNVTTSKGQRYQLEIAFTINFLTFDGLQKVVYANKLDRDDKRSYLVTANGGPLAFPCMSNMLANISAKFHHSGDLVIAASSSELISKRTPVLSEFSTVPYILPHMFSFIIGNLSSTSTTTEHTNVTVFYRSDGETIKYREFLAPTTKMLSALGTYLGTSTNTDIVCMPALSSNVIDGWGLIFIPDETLDDPSSNREYEFVKSVAQKLSRQYFGGMVNSEPRWLNDGIVEFLAYNLMGSQYPMFNGMDQMIVDSLQVSLGNDKDAITGMKVANILRMFHDTFGTKVIQRALKTYLQNGKFHITSVSDIVESMHTALLNRNPCSTQMNYPKIISTWLENPGYPLITINLNGCIITITQCRFTFAKKTSSNVTWTIPIWKNPRRKMWFKQKKIRFARPTRWTANWMIAEIAQNATYRVNYDKNLWHDMIDKLESTSFRDMSVVARARLIDDAFNLARGGFIEYDVAWKIANYLVQEREYLPWAAAYRNFKFILHAFNHTDTSNHIMNFIASKVSPLYAELKHLKGKNMKLRNLAMDLACYVGDANCIADVTARMNGAWDTIDVNDAKEIICCSAVRSNGGISKDLFRRMFLLKEQNLDRSGDQRRFIAHCLACSSSPLQLQALTYNSFRDILTPVQARRIRAKIFREAGLVGVDATLSALGQWLLPWKYAEADNRVTYYHEMRELIVETGKWVVTGEQKIKYYQILEDAVKMEFFRKDEKSELMLVPKENNLWMLQNRDNVMKYFSL